MRKMFEKNVLPKKQNDKSLFECELTVRKHPIVGYNVHFKIFKQTKSFGINVNKYKECKSNEMKVYNANCIAISDSTLFLRGISAANSTKGSTYSNIIEPTRRSFESLAKLLRAKIEISQSEEGLTVQVLKIKITK